MMSRFLLVASLLVTVIASPVSSQVVGPTFECVRQCRPLDADAQGPIPATGSEASTTILYGHWEDLLNRAPTNTQLPSDIEPTLEQGFTLPAASTGTGTVADVHFEHNWFHMSSTPGFVEITVEEWRTHQEAGLAADVRIVGDAINLYFYLSAHNTAEPLFLEPLDLAVMPQVGLYARMETGRFEFSPTSTLIAEGDTAGGPGRATLVTLPGQPDIYEFRVPMQVLSSVIPRFPPGGGAGGYLVSINPYQLKVNDDAGAGTQAMQPQWRAHAGPMTPPRLVLKTEPTQTTVSKGLSLVGERHDQAMQFEWSFLSAWGSYDVDDGSLRLTIDGPTPVEPALVSLARSVDHDGHFKPTTATWRWDAARHDLADGTYTVQASVLNLQNTYRLVETLTFEVVHGQPAAA